MRESLFSGISATVTMPIKLFQQADDLLNENKELKGELEQLKLDLASCKEELKFVTNCISTYIGDTTSCYFKTLSDVDAQRVHIIKETYKDKE